MQKISEGQIAGVVLQSWKQQPFCGKRAYENGIQGEICGRRHTML